MSGVVDISVTPELGRQCVAYSPAGEGLQERCHPGRSLQSRCGDLLQERSSRWVPSLLALHTAPASPLQLTEVCAGLQSTYSAMVHACLHHACLPDKCAYAGLTASLMVLNVQASVLMSLCVASCRRNQSA